MGPSAAGANALSTAASATIPRLARRRQLWLAHAAKHALPQFTPLRGPDPGFVNLALFA
jgi:hypothetical protein